MMGPVMRLGEFDLIQRYFAPLSHQFAGARGLVDDTASLRLSEGYEAIITLDTMVSGIHFLKNDPPDQIARKLLRINLSDLASAGASPVGYFLSISAPETITEDWIKSFSEGLRSDQNYFQIHLGGGDMTSTTGPLTLSLTAIGEVPYGDALTRSGAKHGHEIWTSGTIGDAALALWIFQNKDTNPSSEIVSALTARYRLPQPRVNLGLAIRSIASAAIDISDGLIADLEHLCQASRLGAELNAQNIPLSEASKYLIKSNQDLFERALTGGDDYELLFTIPEGSSNQILEIAKSTQVPLTRIGRMTANRELNIFSNSGEKLSYAANGWQHF